MELESGAGDFQTLSDRPKLSENPLAVKVAGQAAAGAATFAAVTHRGGMPMRALWKRVVKAIHWTDVVVAALVLAILWLLL